MNAAPESSRLPILVIEDEPSVLSFVKTALERTGYPVIPANCGADALKLLEAGKFIGIVSDMRTPGGIDGSDVHDWLAAHRPELVSRLVFITGDIVNEETAATLRRTGAPCVEKPFRISQLLDVVRKVVGTPQ
jgi:two-component system, OmpR family, response regulator